MAYFLLQNLGALRTEKSTSRIRLHLPSKSEWLIYSAAVLLCTANLQIARRRLFVPIFQQHSFQYFAFQRTFDSSEATHSLVISIAAEIGKMTFREQP